MTTISPPVSGWTHSTHHLCTSDGTGSGRDAEWEVTVRLGDNGRIVREVRLDGERWSAETRDWCPELTIWPAWAAVESSAAESPLQGVHDYWSASDERLRDSAKWMAAVLGVAVAALIGTSPLAGLREHHPAPVAVVLGAAGLVLLGCTLALVLRVMRPQSVSFTDVQTADQGTRWWPVGGSKGSLRRWKSQVESQQDLYLPCGVNCLTSLRQSMIIEEVTLIALADAAAATAPEELCGRIRQTQVVRAARLKELRDAAARVATIGEFYRVQFRSLCATYFGLFCGVTGTAAIVAAFAWPPD